MGVSKGITCRIIGVVARAAALIFCRRWIRLTGNDILKIEVDMFLPKKERVIKYLEDIENPYRFNCGDTTINLEFTKGAPTLEEKIITLIKSGNNFL